MNFQMVQSKFIIGCTNNVEWRLGLNLGFSMVKMTSVASSFNIIPESTSFSMDIWNLCFWNDF